MFRTTSDSNQTLRLILCVTVVQAAKLSSRSTFLVSTKKLAIPTTNRIATRMTTARRQVNSRCHGISRNKLTQVLAGCRGARCCEAKSREMCSFEKGRGQWARRCLR